MAPRGSAWAKLLLSFCVDSRPSKGPFSPALPHLAPQEGPRYRRDLVGLTEVWQWTAVCCP